jgi:hypothetical protein
MQVLANVMRGQANCGELRKARSRGSVRAPRNR